MDLELSCPLCTGVYTEPKILPCGHSLCKKCAESLITETEDQVDPLNTFYSRRTSLIDKSTSSATLSDTLTSSQSDLNNPHHDTQHHFTLPRRTPSQKSTSSLTPTNAQLDSCPSLSSPPSMLVSSVSSLMLRDINSCYANEDPQQLATVDVCLPKQQKAPRLQTGRPSVPPPAPPRQGSASVIQRRHSCLDIAVSGGQSSHLNQIGQVSQVAGNVGVVANGVSMRSSSKPDVKNKPPIKAKPVADVKKDIGETSPPTDVDKLSLTSEADSGVVCSDGIPPPRTPSLSSLVHRPPPLTLSLGLHCPTCSRWVDVDPTRRVDSLPSNKALERLMGKYLRGGGSIEAARPSCQLCSEEGVVGTVAASVGCRQCRVLYCDACREKCHPSRGPLSSHVLVAACDWREVEGMTMCDEHVGESVSMFCDTCHLPVCCLCIHSGQHFEHKLLSVTSACQFYKSELSQAAQKLSEKAKAGSQFVQRLDSMKQDVQESSLDLEATVVAQCDALVAMIVARKQHLLDIVAAERERKITTLSEQHIDGSAHIRRMTGLLQLSVELLKETDPLVFLQVSNAVIGRVSLADCHFNEVLPMTPRETSTFNLQLNSKSTTDAIHSLDLVHTIVPMAPKFVPGECYADQNRVTVSWRLADPATTAVSSVHGYVLELSEGGELDYRVVYQGVETVCTVEGLHFNTPYAARVKSFNNAGYSAYSATICLHTSEVAWFTFDATGLQCSSLMDSVQLSTDLRTLTSRLAEDRVILGNIGLSRGVHYWEFRIDRFQHDRDPAFGVARFDVARNQLLGKDEKGWSMYVDSSRSWLMHSGQHTRRMDGGICPGSIVGVLLDLDQHSLTFYINRKHVGRVPAFTGLPDGVFYPAVSLNQCTAVTLHSGLRPPNDNYSD